jgi:hypothetical protein
VQLQAWRYDLDLGLGSVLILAFLFLHRQLVLRWLGEASQVDVSLAQFSSAPRRRYCGRAGGGQAG